MHSMAAASQSGQPERTGWGLPPAAQPLRSLNATDGFCDFKDT